MDDEPVLREAVSRRDAALAEARRMDEFIRMYNELRGRVGSSKYGDAPSHQPPPLMVVGETPRSQPDNLAGEFMIDKIRPGLR